MDVVFPNRMFNNSSDITWEELQNLNAGEWFVKVKYGTFLWFVTLLIIIIVLFFFLNFFFF